MALLLMGRTGNGKSSTGNSIVGKKAFIPRGSTAAITAEILKETADINSQEITVVDGPGIGDASFDNYNDINATLTQVKKALDLCPNGFSALLIVLKYGIRFTQQEKDAITMIKSIFGPDVVRKYGVIVMSHGDSFELDTEDEEVSFEDWCKEQTGDVKALFTECDNRCVLFNNRTKDLKQQKAQLDSLMSKVKVTSISSQGKNYTLEEDYKEAERERTKMLVKSKLSQLEKETDEVLDEISDQLNRDNYTKDESLEMLNTCNAKITKLKSDLQNEDKNTGCTKELQTRVALLETTVQLKLKRIQAQTSEHAEEGKNQNGGSSVMSYFTGMVSRGRASIPSLPSAREKIGKIAAVLRYAFGVAAETVSDNPLKDQSQGNQTKDASQNSPGLEKVEEGTNSNSNNQKD